MGVRQSGQTSEGEVLELLKIANGYLPRIRLEYDRVKEEINLSKAELNSWEAELNNMTLDRNIALKKREDELQRNIDEMENKKAKLQKIINGSKQRLAEPQGNNAYNDSLNLEIIQEEINI